jgi:diaminopimelate decarboxylase
MSKTEHAAATLNAFAIENGQLMIGGMAISRLAERVGQTPFYAYDRAKITERVALLRQHLPKEILLHYAIKANPMAAVVQHLAGLVDGFDLASGGEMQTALDTPMAADNISFAGPGKSEAEISSAIAAGVTLNLESESELEKVATCCEQLGITANVAVRVNPDFELKASGMKMGGGPKPFGIDAERVPSLLKRISALDLDFQGFHIFSGSQNLKAEAIIEAQKKTFALAYRLAEDAPSPLKKLNIGGGFGIPYFPGEQPLDLLPICEQLSARLAEKNQRLPETKIVMELGRYLVGEAGVYVGRVIDRKVSRGQVFLVADGGLHQHLAASGNFGQVIRKNYPVLIANKMANPKTTTKIKTEIASIVGPLCTPLDILADKMTLPVAAVGDFVVILQSGAYGFSASPHGFLSHGLALERLV